MTLPADAKFEVAVSEDVAVWDVSHLLEHGPGQYRQRDPKAIIRLYVHKSGADGPNGFKGAEGMARFCTRPKPAGREWPGAPYQFWLPRAPDRDEDGRACIYRTQRDDLRSFHTGGAANEHGIGVCLQGAYDGEWDLLSTGRPRVEVEPTHVQKTMLAVFIMWAEGPMGYDLAAKVDATGIWLSGHWEADRFGGHAKKVCPGDWARQYVIDRRGVPGTIGPRPTVFILPERGELLVSAPSTRDLQRALDQLGFDPGPIDAIFGYRSRFALERFQKAEGLVADGWYGPRTADALLLALRAKGISKQDDWERKVP